MEKLLFIASIQYGEPPTGGGAQPKINCCWHILKSIMT